MQREGRAEAPTRATHTPAHPSERAAAPLAPVVPGPCAVPPAAAPVPPHPPPPSRGPGIEIDLERGREVDVEEGGKKSSEHREDGHDPPPGCA